LWEEMVRGWSYTPAVFKIHSPLRSGSLHSCFYSGRSVPPSRPLMTSGVSRLIFKAVILTASCLRNWSPIQTRTLPSPLQRISAHASSDVMTHLREYLRTMGTMRRIAMYGVFSAHTERKDIHRLRSSSISICRKLAQNFRD